MDAPQPQQIGRYRIEGTLGQGAMGRVYLAHDPHLERRVALKILSPHPLYGHGDEDKMRRRFLDEARAAARLNHPAVVMVLDAGTDTESGWPYMAMEWVDGPTLQRLIEEQGHLPMDRVVAVGSRVALALDHAHQQGLIHRDVKPGNILMAGGRLAKVSDFGIAKVMSANPTLTGSIVGSPQYMSPEQLAGGRLDGRSDLFSLGVVLYHCAAGLPPFAGDSLAAITYKLVHTEPTPPADHNPEVGEALAAVIARAMAKDPADRFQRGAELAAALEAALEEGPDLDTTLPARQERRLLETVSIPPADGGDRRPAKPAAATTESTDWSSESPTVRLAGEHRRPPAPPDERAGKKRRWLWLGLPAALLAALVLALIGWGHGGGSGQGLPADEVLAGLDLERPDTAAPAPSVESAAAAAGPSAEALEARPDPQATLELVYRNRLKRATLTVFVDGQRVASRSFTGDGVYLERATRKPASWRLPVAAGDRNIEVRLAGRDQELARGTIQGALAADRSHRLRVSRLPLSSRLSLEWQD